jgi:hypothetical protein
MGSRSTRTSSRWSGTVCVSCSVVTYLRSRARPVSPARGADAQLLLRARHRVVADEEQVSDEVRKERVEPEGDAG